MRTEQPAKRLYHVSNWGWGCRRKTGFKWGVFTDKMQPPPPPPSNSLLLTVPRRWFWCGYLLPVFGVIVSVMFHLMFVHFTFSSVDLLSDHLLGNSCPLGWPFVLIVFCLFVIFGYFPFWFWERDLPSDCFNICSLLSHYFHHLNKLWFSTTLNSTYQVSWKSVNQFWRRFL